MEVIREGISRTGETLVLGWRVLARHWPALVGLYLLGTIGRMAFLWLAVWVSGWNSTLAVFVLPFAPLSSMIALVLMLRVASESLPAFTDLFRDLPARLRWRDHLTVGAQMLLPFLAVYASQGLLKEDAQIYVLNITMDEALNNLVPQYERAVYAQGVWLVALVVATLAVRKMLSFTSFAEKSVAGAGITAYVEALWLVTLAQALASNLEALGEWLRTRAFIVGIMDWWERTLRLLDIVGEALVLLWGWASDLVANATYLVALPLAWLMIGAAVNGRKEGFELPTQEEKEKKEKEREERRLRRTVRTAVRSVTSPATEPFRTAWDTFRFIMRTGVIPMILFCLTFFLVRGLSALTEISLRALIGPRSPQLHLGIAPLLELGPRLVYFVTAMALVAAGVNSIVEWLREHEEQSDEPRAAEPEVEPA